jgi:hypothetical protein
MMKKTLGLHVVCTTATVKGSAVFYFPGLFFRFFFMLSIATIIRQAKAIPSSDQPSHFGILKPDIN